EQPKDTFLEEMVDILHFWLSVAMDFKIKNLLRTIYITETKINGFNKSIIIIKGLFAPIESLYSAFPIR
ncbi:dUTP diphosphatase, partial [Bacillus sp. D-CC]